MSDSVTPSPTSINFAEFREVYIATSSIHQIITLGLDPDSEHMIHCPGCRHAHVLLEGDWTRRVWEEFLNGESQGEKLAKSPVKNISAINCITCKTRYLVLPDNEFNQIVEIRELKEQLKAFTDLKDTPSPTPAIQ